MHPVIDSVIERMNIRAYGNMDVDEQFAVDSDSLRRYEENRAEKVWICGVIREISQHGRNGFFRYALYLSVVQDSAQDVSAKTVGKGAHRFIDILLQTVAAAFEFNPYVLAFFDELSQFFFRHTSSFGILKRSFQQNLRFKCALNCCASWTEGSSGEFAKKICRIDRISIS